MPHKTCWYIEKEVLYAEFSGATTVLEARTFLEEMNAYARQGHHSKVHVVVNLSGVTRPLNIAGIAQAFYNFKPDPKVGWAVTVTQQNTALKFTIRLASQVLGVMRSSFDTVQEALDFLREMDSEVNWDKADPGVLTDHCHDTPDSESL